MRFGEPRSSILEEAKLGGVDLVGSVAEGVLRTATCDVPVAAWLEGP